MFWSSDLWNHLRKIPVVLKLQELESEANEFYNDAIIDE